MSLPRLRQVVVAARSLEDTMRALEAALPVRDPFHDEGVGHFGLRNAVYALGDTFVEIVSPMQDGTAAGRQLDRQGGDCGYMVMFEVADEAATRQRIADAGVRIVWDTSRPDIVDLHLHPKDVPGAIVALDVTDPVGSWRWGGPAWTAAIPPHAPGGVIGLTVAVCDPPATTRRWADLLGVPVAASGDAFALGGDPEAVRFVALESGIERIVAVRVATPDGGGPTEIAGVTFDRQPLDGST